MTHARIPLPTLSSLVVTVLLSACGSGIGSAGFGDPYYENLGDGGYDVIEYNITLFVEPVANALSGWALIQAHATQPLVSLNLDLQGLEVDGVIVNGEQAGFSTQDHELTITPLHRVANGTSFLVRVTYHGNPQPIKNVASTLFSTVGWFHAPDGSINVLSEPNGAASWFPVNDHPRDKATYHFDITVPHPWVVAASGILRSATYTPAHTEYVWDMDQPMASYLASINIGEYMVDTTPGPNGVIIRNYITRELPESLRANLHAIPEMMAYFSGLFGPYPFREYGVLIADGRIEPCRNFGGALEVQTLSVHCPKASTLDELTLAHELAHQWFGDDVTIANWQDIWLKEGMATYAEWMWQTRGADLASLAELAATQRSTYVHDSSIRNPPPADIYDYEIYVGGAQVFHALRLKVGDAVFFKILQSYLERYRFGNASTDDFIAIAEEISGQELTPFFASWLSNTQLPELPRP